MARTSKANVKGNKFSQAIIKEAFDYYQNNVTNSTKYENANAIMDCKKDLAKITALCKKNNTWHVALVRLLCASKGINAWQMTIDDMNKALGIK